MRGSSGALVALGLVLAIAPVGAFSQTLAPSPTAAGKAQIHWDPNVRRGVLANGLRYAVMRNSVRNGALSLRLGVGVGSFEESDEERGAAHFVEHLAFGRAPAAPGPSLEAVFATAGVAFGRDRNAETGYYSTVYRVDMPHEDRKTADIAFAWLRSVADGARFTDETVAKERGVILAEREARMTAQDAFKRQVEEFQAPGLRFLSREPIGTLESLAAMTPDRLRGFYERWYRPANAVLVVVGDAPVDELQRRVETAFGGWASRGDLPARAPMGRIDTSRGLGAIALADPSLPTTVGICRIHAGADGRPADDVDRQREKIRTDLWVAVFQARLAMLVQDPASNVLGAQVITDWQSREMAGACIAAVPAHDDWRAGLSLSAREVRHMLDAPPTEDELEIAIGKARSRLRGAIGQAATRASSDLATQIVDAELNGEVVPSPSEAFRAFDSAVADTAPADVKAAFARDWSGAGPLIAVLAPTPPSRAEVEAAWSAPTPAKPVATAAAVAATAAAAAGWPYEFGPPGKVIRRQAFTGPAFDRVTFSNGVIVNLMRTDFDRSQTKVVVTFGSGRREIPDGDRLAAALGVVLFDRMGLGRLDYAQIGALYAQDTHGAKLSIGDEAFSLAGDASSDRGLAAELRLLAAYMSDPGFRNIDPLLGAVVDAIYRTYRTRPEMVVSLALSDAIAPDGPNHLPPKAELDRLRTANLERILKPSLTRSTPEISIVGDFDQDAALRAAAATFGALPARSAADRRQAHTWFLHFPDKPIAPLTVTHDGPVEQAIVGAVWPLYVATPSRRREEYALDLAAKLMGDALRHRLRDALGKTYSPGATTFMPDDSDQGILVAVVETRTADAELAQHEIRSVADRLARGEFTDADLASVRTPFLADLAAGEHTNRFWVACLANSVRDNVALNDCRIRRDTFASITTAEVRRAAAAWLGRAPVMVTALPTSLQKARVAP